MPIHAYTYTSNSQGRNWNLWVGLQTTSCVVKCFKISIARNHCHCHRQKVNSKEFTFKCESYFYICALCMLIAVFRPKSVQIKVLQGLLLFPQSCVCSCKRAYLVEGRCCCCGFCSEEISALTICHLPLLVICPQQAQHSASRLISSHRQI